MFYFLIGVMCGATCVVICSAICARFTIRINGRNDIVLEYPSPKNNWNRS